MLRRCPAPLIVLAAALGFGLGSQPMSSRADSLTSSSDTSNTPTVSLEYTLTTTQAIAAASGSPPAQGSSNPPTPQVLAVDTPVSIVTPRSGSSTGPLQIVSDSSGYYYNNPTELLVDVGNNHVGRHADHPAGPGPELLRPGAGRRQQPDVLVDLRQGHRQRQPSARSPSSRCWTRRPCSRSPPFRSSTTATPTTSQGSGSGHAPRIPRADLRRCWSGRRWPASGCGEIRAEPTVAAWSGLALAGAGRLPAGAAGLVSSSFARCRSVRSRYRGRAETGSRSAGKLLLPTAADDAGQPDPGPRTQ